MTRYDETYKDNLYAMMKAGYLNFDRNLLALFRTGNKFDHAVSEVSDNIEWKVTNGEHIWELRLLTGSE